MIYNLFVSLIWLISLPLIFLLSFKKKYKRSLRARFLLYKNPKLSKSSIHFHACSFGEINALKPLLNQIKDFSLSTTTQTGFDEACKISKNVSFLPFENLIPIWKNQTKVLVVFEAELWLNLFKYYKKDGSYTILLNARISSRSYPKYRKFRFYYKMIFSYIDKVYAQTQVDKERLIQLGARNVEVIGNIKSVNSQKLSKIYPKFKERLIIIASSHDKEEERILNEIELDLSDKLIIAPRHPQRFDQVDKIFKNFAQKNGFSYERFAQNLGLNSKCILLDTLGELNNFYAISDIVILCGSFEDGIGGHNFIEPATFQNAVISGEFYFNQLALFYLCENIYISSYKDLNSLLKKNLKKAKIKDRFDLSKILKEIKEKI